MKIPNPEALHDYTILERIEAGIKLTGPEVKSVRAGHVSLKGAFVRLMDTEAYLVNAHIYPYTFARIENYDPQRTRKLLLSKKELVTLKGKIEGQNLALIPLSLYTTHNLIKVEVGLARGKKQFEKREILRRKDQKRELEREHRGKVR